MIDRIICPVCGSLFDLEQAWDDADGRRFVELLTSLPPAVVRPLFNYLKLFKPEKQALRWNRVLKLTEEIAPMIKAAQIQRNGIAYAVPVPLWEAALTELVRNRPKTLELPLKKHAYLLSILANQAEKQAADLEQQQIEQQRNRGRSGVDVGPKTVAEVMPKQPKQKPKSKPPEGWRGKL